MHYRQKLAERWARFHCWHHRKRKHHRPLQAIAAPTCIEIRIHRKRKHHKMQVTIKYADPTTLADLTTAIPEGDFAFVEVQRSIDNGQTYDDVGHSPPGADQFVDDVSALAPGDLLYKLNSVDTQNPVLVGPDSAIVKVTIPAPELQAIAPPTDVTATIA